MQQQQPSCIKWQRLALSAQSRMALCPMVAARILGPKCRASKEEERNNYVSIKRKNIRSRFTELAGRCGNFSNKKF